MGVRSGPTNTVWTPDELPELLSSKQLPATSKKEKKQIYYT